jgi:ribosomal-protein-alanine N-acetyltransferase
MEYEIRQAGPADLPDVMYVFTEVAKDLSVSVSTYAETYVRTQTIAGYLEESEDEDFAWHALVVLMDGKVVGVCDFLRSPLERTHHVVELGIGFLPEYRGRGLGRALMEYAMEWSRDRGVKKVRLFVVEGNEAALRLYDSLGFVHTGVYRKEVSGDNGYMDLLIMEKFL